MSSYFIDDSSDFSDIGLKTWYIFAYGKCFYKKFCLSVAFIVKNVPRKSGFDSNVLESASESAVIDLSLTAKEL